MPIFIVDTISSFRMRYAIEAKSLEDAYDEVTMNGSPESFEEMSQKHIGEQIIDGRELTKTQFDSMVQELTADKEEMISNWMGDELIHKIKYED